jgi:hypothetical protein
MLAWRKCTTLRKPWAEILTIGIAIQALARQSVSSGDACDRDGRRAGLTLLRASAKVATCAAMERNEEEA